MSSSITITGTTGSDIISSTLSYAGLTSTFAFYGDFGGGTLTVECSFDNETTWIPLKKIDGESLEITSDEVHIITIGRCDMRFKIASTTTDPNVSVTIR